VVSALKVGRQTQVVPGAREVILDTNPGIDGALAIVSASSSAEWDVLGITSVFGHADVEVRSLSSVTVRCRVMATEFQFNSGDLWRQLH